MIFDYNKNKSQTNLEKHGIDFESAKALWRGPSVEFVARQAYEDRFAIIGPLEAKLYTCIYTLRGNCIRLISCRRSRKKEQALYEKNLPKT